MIKDSKGDEGGWLSMRYKNKAEEAVHILLKNIDSIQTVEEWAAACYISYSGLRKWTGNGLAIIPRDLLRDVRYEVVCQLIQREGVDATCLYIAIESGAGRKGDHLHKFLKRNFGITFTQLKKALLSGEREIDFVWTDASDFEE